MDGMDSMDMGKTTSWMVEESPDAECYANNDAFLQTLAYCMYSHCHTETNSTLQRYWEMNVAGNMENQPFPKESYQQALGDIGFIPNITINSTEVLQSASLVSDTTFSAQFQTLSVFERVETTHEAYGLVLILTGAIIPIALSFVRFIPFPRSWAAKFEAYLILPPLIGNRHNVPLFNTFIMPTRGQALFIAYLIIVNIILSAVGFQSAQPNTWYASQPREIVTYISNRAGVLSFANIPLLFLYSGRNNVLLWLTNWSHSTFLLLHRWVAAICTIQACLHSAIYLQIYVADGTHASESKLPYWYWGIIATLAMAILLPASALPFRQKCYEIFLASHVVLSVLALVGCYLHIFYRFAHQWGYENWIYAAFGIWAFERGFRILRMARQRLLTANVSVIDDDYVKLEIPGATAHGHVYLYFPTLTWRIWENHPFSVISDVQFQARENGSYKEPVASLFDTKAHSAQAKVIGEDSESERIRKSDQDIYARSGLLLYVRTRSGLTQKLRGKSQLTVLVEPAHIPASIPGTATTKAPNIIAIAGGVGITAVVPTLLGHSGWHKLFWAVRSKPLANSVESTLGESTWKQLNAVIFHDQRMEIPQLLADEIAKFTGSDLTIVISGPPKMADEVRVIVADIIKSRPSLCLILVEESFSW